MKALLLLAVLSLATVAVMSFCLPQQSPLLAADCPSFLEAKLAALKCLKAKLRAKLCAKFCPGGLEAPLVNLGGYDAYCGLQGGNVWWA